MSTWIIAFLVLLIGGIATLLPLYAAMLRDFEKYNEDEFKAAGSPKLFMISPSRGLRLQRFIYFDSRNKGIHPKVASQSTMLAVLTPLYVLFLFGLYFWGMWSELAAILK